MEMENTSLLMVYNAEEGMFNAMSDTAHKIFSPDTYECSLCQVTHGMVSMRWEWRKFLGSLPLKKQFFHRSDFAETFGDINIVLPAILTQEEGQKPKVLIGKEELTKITDLSELIALMEQRLSLS